MVIVAGQFLGYWRLRPRTIPSGPKQVPLLQDADKRGGV
jgi:hypothetical protein